MYVAEVERDVPTRPMGLEDDRYEQQRELVEREERCERAQTRDARNQVGGLDHVSSLTDVLLSMDLRKLHVEARALEVPAYLDAYAFPWRPSAEVRQLVVGGAR